jgi:signal transduction histidine kinase
MFAETRKQLAKVMPRAIEFLFPHAAEADESFQYEIRRLSRRALHILGAVEIGMPLLGSLAGLFARTTDVPAIERFLILGFFCLGIATLAVARTDVGTRHARPAALLSVFLAAALLIWSEYLTAPNLREAAYLSYKDLILVMLVALAVIPARPLQIFSLVCSIVVLPVGFVQLAVQRNWMAGDAMLAEIMAGGGTFALLCAALSAVNYRRLYATHRSHQEAMRAERRLLLSENTATIGRLAAGLSHEMNTPLGALKSSVGTLCAAASKYASAPDEQKGRLLPLIGSLGDTVNQSAGRLAEIVERMERLTNLDRAEVQSVDLNDLLRDVASLAGPLGRDKVNLELTLRPLPRVICRPQQLSAVFVNLVGTAMEAAETNGRISVSTSHEAGHVEVLMQYGGRTVSAEELASFFDPRFQTSGDRVTAGNWSLFSARQTIREHGGEIRVTSGQERGTELTIVLPCQTA